VSKEEREFLDQLRHKSIEAAAEIMASLQRLKLLYDEITDDGSGTPMPRPRVGDFFYRLARFELEHASNVIRLGNSQAEMIFDHVRQLARRSRGGAVLTQVLALRAADERSDYTGSFEIRNPFDAEADARFELSPLRNANGDPVALPCDETGAPIRLQVACGDGPVRPYQTAQVEMTLARAGVTETLFGEIAVYLSADVERQVARRALKVRQAVVEGER
jgi:hypothetical protein